MITIRVADQTLDPHNIMLTVSALNVHLICTYMFENMFIKTVSIKREFETSALNMSYN